MSVRVINFVFRLVDKIRRLNPTQGAGLLAHLLMPALVLAVTIFFGGGVSIGFEKGVAIAELKTEINETGKTSTKRGVVVIAEPSSAQSSYIIPLARQGVAIWSSLDEKNTLANHQVRRVLLTAKGVYGENPLISEVNEPIALIVEGELGTHIEIPGNGLQPVSDWRLASRRSVYLVLGVLISCSIALGIGAVIGVPAVKPYDDDTSQIGTEPDKK